MTDSDANKLALLRVFEKDKDGGIDIVFERRDEVVALIGLLQKLRDEMPDKAPPATAFTFQKGR